MMNSSYERVRVISRIRPFTVIDPDDADLSVIVVDDKHVSIDGKYVYEVDRVYPMEAPTEDIFNEVVKPLIKDFLSGYNITLMAYGQTGTGKTFTMDGLTPLAIGSIVLDGFRGNIEDLSFQYIEVYGDKIRDLLSEDPVESSEHLQLYDDNAEGTLLTGAVRVRARTLRQVMEVVEYGTRKRATGATNINEYSSRSHSIFTIFNHRDKSKLHLVDLAGSERADKTRNAGQRFQESIAINSGLLSLGNVIRALRRNHVSQNNPSSPNNKLHHVPYRTSKLTRLLQDSLGGNSRTVFIACIAPDSYNKGETKRTLEYCTLASQIHNTPMPNYAHLYEEQSGAGVAKGNIAAVDEYPVHQMSKVPMVPEETYMQLKAEKEMRDGEVQQLRQEMERMTARVNSLERDLLKDEVIFKRQIHEIQRLTAENAKYKRRVDYLEGHPQPVTYARAVEKEKSPSPKKSEATALIERVMRMHGFLDEQGDDTKASPPKRRTVEESGRPLSSSSVFFPSSTNAKTQGESSPSPHPRALPPQHPPAAAVAAAVAGDKENPTAAPPVADLAQKALSYQALNSQLKGKMSTLEAMLDSQRREAAMLRVEVAQLQQCRVSPRYH